MKRAKKNGWNINKAQTYHKVDSSNLVQINKLLNYSYAFVFDLKHTITYEEFKEKLIRDFSPTSEKIGAIAFFDNNNDKVLLLKLRTKIIKVSFYIALIIKIIWLKEHLKRL